MIRMISRGILLILVVHLLLVLFHMIICRKLPHVASDQTSEFKNADVIGLNLYEASLCIYALECYDYLDKRLSSDQEELSQ